jgi:hypothetical protein
MTMNIIPIIAIGIVVVLILLSDWRANIEEWQTSGVRDE